MNILNSSIWLFLLRSNCIFLSLALGFCVSLPPPSHPPLPPYPPAPGSTSRSLCCTTPTTTASVTTTTCSSTRTPSTARSAETQRRYTVSRTFVKQGMTSGVYQAHLHLLGLFHCFIRNFFRVLNPDAYHRFRDLRLPICPSMQK